MSQTSPKQNIAKHSGFVYDFDSDEPIEGAIVTIDRYGPRNNKIESTRHVTDSDGQYKFEVPEDQRSGSLNLVFDIEHADYAPSNGRGYGYQMMMVNEKLGQAPFFEKRKLRKAAKVSGRVVDDSGKPLAAVKVSAYWTSKDDTLNMHNSNMEVQTDSEGRYQLNFVPGLQGFIWFISNEHARKQMIFDEVQEGDLGEIVLETGIEVRGRVSDMNGTPLSQIPVIAFDIAAREECGNDVGSMILRKAETDEDGIFTLTHMTSGEHDLRVLDYRWDRAGDRPKRIKLPAVFSNFQISVSKENANHLHEIQATPHVTYSGVSVNSKGEPRNGHLPHFSITTDDGKEFAHECVAGENVGEFSAMVPANAIKAEISLMTDEHTSYMIETGTQKFYDSSFHEISGIKPGQDFDDLKITWYETTLLVVKLVDKDGNPADALLDLSYVNFLGVVHLNNHGNSVYRSVCLVPDEEFKIETASSVDVDGNPVLKLVKTMSVAEGETKEITLVVDPWNAG